MKPLIIGVDCATQPGKVGVACARFAQEKWRLERAVPGRRPLSDLILEIAGSEDHVLIALDAPLGWPEPLGRTMAKHQAGEPIHEESNALFKRATDVRVALEFCKLTPLEVGANLIARTAKSAVDLLADLGTSRGRTIPLAWSPEFESWAAIEVYPAATLRARCIQSTGYKGQVGRGNRQKIAKSLSDMMEIQSLEPEMIGSDHILDAVLCVLAGIDFLSQECLQPEGDEELRKHKEGWIWVKKP